MEILHLYRPAVPSMRAQTVQVVHTAHALAGRGHRVTLLCDRDGNGPDGLGSLLDSWGLPPSPGLNLELAPLSWRPGAGLWFRSRVIAWARRAGSAGVVYAREQKYVALLPDDIPVVYEAHACEAMVAEDAGRAVGPVEALERAVLSRSAGLVANCGGTLGAIEEYYSELPRLRRVIHNGTASSRVLRPAPAAVPTVMYAGSPRAYKGLSTCLDSVASWPSDARLLLVGGAPDGPLPARVDARPPVPYAELPALLAQAHALLLPLDDNLFGRRLTSPLKLWDYLATGIAIVAADLPTVREIAGDRPYYYRPGDPKSLAEAVQRALGDVPCARGSLLRSWADRAAEIDQVIDEVSAAARARART